MGPRKNLSPDRIWTHDLPNTGRALYPLSYENSWRARSLKAGVHVKRSENWSNIKGELLGLKWAGYTTRQLTTPKESPRLVGDCLVDEFFCLNLYWDQEIAWRVRSKSNLQTAWFVLLSRTLVAHHFGQFNRPFAGSGHMVRNKLHWDAKNAVGLSKQRKVGLDR